MPTGPWCRSYSCGLTFAWLACVMQPTVSAAEPTLRSERDPCAVNRGLADFKPISEIPTEPRIRATSLPADCSDAVFAVARPADRESMNRSDWPVSTGLWESPDFLHQPTYFDDTPLERYGHTTYRWLQPVVSGVHFFGDLALLPVRMAGDHPWRLVSPMALDRPGSATMPIRERWVRPDADPLWLFPLSLRPPGWH